jgi:hypothetical protein
VTIRQVKNARTSERLKSKFLLERSEYFWQNNGGFVVL